MPRSQQPKDAENMMKQLITSNPNNIVLDVGLGDGRWGEILKGKIKQIDGLEIWEPYVQQYNLKEKYDNIIISNMLTFNNYGMYDIVIFSDVIEHVDKKSAIDLINKVKDMVKEIFISLPTTICTQDGDIYGNPYEEHIAQWTHEEVIKDLQITHLHTGYNPNKLVKIGTYYSK